MKYLLKSLLLILFLAGVSSVSAQLGGQNLPDLTGFASAIAQSANAAAPTNNKSAATTGSSATFRSGMNVPSVNPGATAREIGKQLRTMIEQKAGPQPALAQLEEGMPVALTNVENELEKIGFAKRDFGVAMAYAFLYNYETATKQDISDQAGQVAAKTVAIAIKNFWGAKFATLAPAEQEKLYESLIVSTTLISALAQQTAQAGKKEDEAGIRQMAGQFFQKLIGAPPENVKIAPDGKITGLVPDQPTNNQKAAPNPRPQSTNLPTTKGGAMPPSSVALGGAQIFVKYAFRYDPMSSMTKIYIDNLMLFPSGTAFDDLPSEPITSFDEATLRQKVKPFYVGSWKMVGDNLVLSFPKETSTPTRTLKKYPKGWYDGDGAPKADSPYDIYYPVSAANPKQLIGAWKNSELGSVGTMGGTAPMVTGGSNSNLNLNSDGTFDKLRKSFASATNANVGDAYKGDATFGAYSNNKEAAAGRWQLDGLLLTLEENGVRRVYLAYFLPHWNTKAENTDMMIGDNRWERPGKD